jgi:phenylacetate-CoA ligase
MKDRTHKALLRADAARFPGFEAGEVLSFQRRLDDSQWFTAERIVGYQLQQLKALVKFSATSVDAYKDSIDFERVADAATLEAALAAIPLLPRGRLAEEPLSFRAMDLPAGQSFAGIKQSSGTSGHMVSVETTNLAFGWQNALTLRAQLWANRDFNLPAASIRKDRRAAAPYPDGTTTEAWGTATIFPFKTGPASFLGATSSLEQQWEWLSRMKPSYLQTYPSIVRAFASRAQKEGRGPCALKGITTVGETVDADLRDEARRYLGAEVFDIYSAEEIGILAIQCPECRRYHAQDEALIVEILDDAGQACGPGITGRVVVTPLFNYATPLLRYDMGDIAEVGTACACGRGLRTINRIFGRQRNIFKLADGRTFWPSVGAKQFSSFVNIRQHQFRQLAHDQLEVVLAVEGAVAPEHEERVRATILKKLPAPMEISFRYVDEIPREASGKYQEFVCLVP